MTLEGIGGQIRDSAEDGTTSVATMRIADFINNVVAVRRCLYEPVSPSFTPTSLLFSPTHCQDLSRIPKGRGEELPPAVVMKLDVEGKVGCCQVHPWDFLMHTKFQFYAILLQFFPSGSFHVKNWVKILTPSKIICCHILCWVHIQSNVPMFCVKNDRPGDDGTLQSV